MNARLGVLARKVLAAPFYAAFSVLYVLAFCLAGVAGRIDRP